MIRIPKPFECLNHRVRFVMINACVSEVKSGVRRYWLETSQARRIRNKLLWNKLDVRFPVKRLSAYSREDTYDNYCLWDKHFYTRYLHVIHVGIISCFPPTASWISSIVITTTKTNIILPLQSTNSNCISCPESILRTYTPQLKSPVVLFQLASIVTVAVVDNFAFSPAIPLEQEYGRAPYYTRLLFYSIGTHCFPSMTTPFFHSCPQRKPFVFLGIPLP